MRNFFQSSSPYWSVNKLFFFLKFFFYLVFLYLVEEADKEIDKIDPTFVISDPCVYMIMVFFFFFFFNRIKKQVKAYARSLAFIIIMVFSKDKPNVYTVEMNFERTKAAKSHYKVQVVKLEGS